MQYWSRRGHGGLVPPAGTPMNSLLYLVPIALLMGAVGLVAFLWSLDNGQYDDLEGAAERILFDDEDEPLMPGR